MYCPFSSSFFSYFSYWHACMRYMYIVYSVSSVIIGQQNMLTFKAQCFSATLEKATKHSLNVATCLLLLLLLLLLLA